MKKTPPHLHHPAHHPQSLHAHQRPLAFRLERWQRQSLYGLIAALLASGLIWLVAHYFLAVQSEFGVLPHPAEHWAMQIHGALILPLAFLSGSLLLQHIRRAHRAGKNRNSGWSMLALLGWLAFSGYGLYYLASDASRLYWSVPHWLTGLLLAPALWLHIRLGRRALKRPAGGLPQPH